MRNSKGRHSGSHAALARRKDEYMDETIEIFDKREGYLFTALNEQEAEQLCRNAIKSGLHPCTREEYEYENGQ